MVAIFFVSFLYNILLYLCLKKIILMKYIILFIIGCYHFTVLGQTDSQKKWMLSNTNIFELNELSQSFQIMESARMERIVLFLNSNPSFEKRYTSKEGSLFEIKDIVDGKPVYISNQNRLSALGTRTSRLHNGGSLGLNLEGQDMYIGIWDGGSVMKSHVEFMNDATPSISRVVTGDSPGVVTDSHATHVGGTMVAKGLSVDAKGMAPQASLVSYNWTNDDTEVVSEITNNALLLSNHSYGVPVLNSEGTLNVPNWWMGCYNTDARNWDLIAANAPYYLMVVSAGNNGTDTYTGGLMPGFDKLTGEKNSKNNLVIANSNPFVSQINGVLISNQINSSSSQGPSDDGRVKPDIAADGTAVFSTYNTTSSSYATLTGTSMAAPNTSGTLLLLQQYFSQQSAGDFMRSSTLKGLVCHTAVESGTSPGPDARFGWGLLDAEKAVVLIQNSKAAQPTSILSEIVLDQGQTYSFEVNVAEVQNLQATICWTDPAGAARDSQLNSPIPALVNDLDLRIIKNTEINFPWKLQLSSIAGAAIKSDNIVDNVERVDVNNAIGTYTVQVSHKGTLQSGSQSFSMIVSGFNTAMLSTAQNSVEKFTLFPNPTNGLLKLNTGFAEVSNVSIIDLSGKSIDLKFDSNGKTVDVSSLQTGLYFLRFIANGQFFTMKFVKL
jgi:serine protease AprX